MEIIRDYRVQLDAIDRSPVSALVSTAIQDESGGSRGYSQGGGWPRESLLPAN